MGLKWISILGGEPYPLWICVPIDMWASPTKIHLFHGMMMNQWMEWEYTPHRAILSYSLLSSFCPCFWGIAIWRAQSSNILGVRGLGNILESHWRLAHSDPAAIARTNFMDLFPQLTSIQLLLATANPWWEWDIYRIVSFFSMVTSPWSSGAAAESPMHLNLREAFGHPGPLSFSNWTT